MLHKDAQGSVEEVVARVERKRRNRGSEHYSHLRSVTPSFTVFGNRNQLEGLEMNRSVKAWEHSRLTSVFGGSGVKLKNRILSIAS